MHTQLSTGRRGLTFHPSLHLLSYFNVKSKGLDDAAGLCNIGIKHVFSMHFHLLDPEGGVETRA